MTLPPLQLGGGVRLSPPEPMLAADTERVYLHPGQMYAATHRCAITTVLGSCVSVCLYDAEMGIGGANHYVLPHAGSALFEPLRFGPTAIQALIDSLTSFGARRSRLRAKVYGGAHVLRAMTGERWHLGGANVEVARAVLSAQRIPVQAMEVGGLRGRKLQFLIRDGSAWVKEI
jgi:chemotaxis protein CheD